MNSPLNRLTDELAKLPSIGRKTAMRLALYILRQPQDYAFNLADALKEAVQQIRSCSVCHHITSQDPCEFCQDQKRNQGLICVVEETSDVFALEKTGGFRGCYHILQGSLSPLDGVGPDDLMISSLIHRVKQNSIEEIILATNPTVTGDATALYISKLLKPFEIKITKLASGIPMGTDIEYIDQMTLSRALEYRVDY